MKLCKVCLTSDMLCSVCSRHVDSGAIKKIDVDLSRALYKISKESGFEIDFVDTVESNGRIFVIVESKYAARFIGPGGRTIKKLVEAVGRPIKMLERAEGSDKHIIEKLIAAQIIGINKVYTQSGEAMKVRIDRRYMKNVQPLADVAGKVLGRKISFVFE